MKQDSTRDAIRQQIRTLRKQLSQSEQRLASEQLVAQFAQLTELTDAKNIALYLANDGELNPVKVFDWCWDKGISTYIPVLHPFSKGQLLFLHYAKGAPLIKNRYGILEPKLSTNNILPVSELDIIFTPLVAFDKVGHRLGMGGGYYDRTLAPFTHSNKPKAIGLAHDCQQLEALSVEKWDIPLEKIVTPSKTWQWK